MPPGAANPHDTNDREALLVQRAKERSPAAWAEIYDNTYSKLYRYCYTRTSNDAHASELASRVYLEALEGIDRYQYRGRPLLAWLYRIARNLVSDFLRKRQQEWTALQEAGTLLLPAQAEHPGTPIDDRYDIEVALRQLIVLRYYAGFTTAEIAQAMDRSERAVYSMEVRALASLRRLIAPELLEKTGRHAAPGQADEKESPLEISEVERSA